ncbi:hypothetical protein Fmac_011621 [Flemingia macrophylla]|uniref:Uncharacterized protein n=1 Tax=Flemingia macrophylla TaxID=520843 RepID=A0ABD1MQ27_9FABA
MSAGRKLERNQQNATIFGSGGLYSGRVVKNLKDDMIVGAPGGLELAQGSSIGNENFQNLLESPSLQHIQLKWSYRICFCGHHIAMVNETFAHFCVTGSEDLADIVPNEIHSIENNPSCPYQLAFHLEDGWLDFVVLSYLLIIN